ncbi:MAG: 30S ribosomal protein S13 [Nanoarchaeota archaeon]
MEQKTEKTEERIIRILSRDIEGGMKIYPGLAKIKGVSWSFSNAICQFLGLDKNRKISSLTENEIKKISDFVKNPSLSPFLLNRRFDLESGKNLHLNGSDLDLRKDFDIKRLKTIKSYKGLRHSSGLPVRGQRTRGNFRKNRRKSVGIKKKINSPEKTGRTFK